MAAAGADELSELVMANIREVLEAVAGEDDQRQAADAGGAAASSSQDAPLPAGAAMAGTLDVSLLEVPSCPDATIRLLKARVRSLEEQLGAALALCKEKDSALAELQRQTKLASQKEAASSKGHRALEAQVERHRCAAEAAREALAAKEQQLKELAKETTRTDKERRQLEQEGRSRDARLQYALQEVERFKQLLQEVKLQGQGAKDMARSEQAGAAAQVKRLERQRGELVAVLRKQARLVDVLRRQKAHLEAARLLAFSEEEFMRVLDSGGA